MSSNIRIIRICQQCEKEFTAITTVIKYCGEPCSKKAYKARKKAEKLEASNKETLKQINKPIIELQAQVKKPLSFSESVGLPNGGLLSKEN